MRPGGRQTHGGPANALYELKPDWALELGSMSDDLEADLEACIAALQYVKVKDAAGH